MRTASGMERPTFARTPDGRVTWELEIEVLTPIFGGGVVLEGHRKPSDPVTAIRVPSIRGQLRFWWRAVNPRGCQKVEELADAEAQIFGRASRAGALDLSLAGNAPVTVAFPVLDGKFGARKVGNEVLTGVAYGAFPLRSTLDGDVTHGVLHEVKEPFRLVCAFASEARDDVRAALWAWLAFGGIGGRTRRGFGAVALKAGPAEADLGLEAGWKSYSSKFGPRPWPTIPADRKFALRDVASGTQSPILALNDLLGRLRSLRQGEGVGRTKRQGGSNTPGRSYWPEADSIRSIQKAASSTHRERLTRVPEFPRAAFGTPIIFHFKDGRQGDPRDSTLNPVGCGRLASPLIVRPARSSAGLTLRALRLDHPPPLHGFELTWSGNSVAVPGRSPDPDFGLNGRPSPLVVGAFRTTDPIVRFFKELDQ